MLESTGQTPLRDLLDGDEEIRTADPRVAEVSPEGCGTYFRVRTNSRLSAEPSL